MGGDDREIIKTLDASPSKKIIKNKATVAEFENALVEIIDNAIDYWREREHYKTLVFEIKVKSKESVEIKWNMGIPEERWEPLVKMGMPEHVLTTSIGVWGEGAKIAMFAIGNKIDIYSRVGNRTIDISIPEDWLDENNKNWLIPVYKDTIKMEEDTTRILIKVLNEKKLPKTDSNVVDFVAKTFGMLIKNEEENSHKMTIIYNGEEIKPKTYATKENIENNFAFVPGYEPTEHIFEEEGLSIKMIIGILAVANQKDAGVYLYGNDRLFAERLRDESVGYGTGKNSRIPSNHPHGMRLQAHIFFYGMPAVIPWMAPLKYGFNKKSEMAEHISEWIQEHGGKLVHFVKKTMKSEILPYSKMWHTLSEEDKQKIIFDKAADKRKNISAAEKKKEWENAPESIKRGIDVKDKIDVWDHTIDKIPPAKKAKYYWDLTLTIGKYAESNRENRNLGSIEINKKIQSIAGESRLEALESILEMGELENPEETKPIAIRLSQQKINKLRLDTGEDKPTEVLNKIIKIYENFQELKHHKVFKDLSEKELDDEPFIKKLVETLNKMVKK